MVKSPPRRRATKFCMPPPRRVQPALRIRTVDSSQSLEPNQWKGWAISASIHVAILLSLFLIAFAGVPRGMGLLIEMSTIDSPTELAFLSMDMTDSMQSNLDPAELNSMHNANQPVSIDGGLALMPADGPVIDPLPGWGAMSGEGVIPSNTSGKIAHFFGATAQGKRFVYVLDISGSMNRRGGKRFKRARAELLRSIRQLQPSQEFYVILYSDKTILMQSERLNRGFRPASDEVKDSTEQWLNSVRPKGGTEPQQALAVAGEMYPDAVFFLSDGDFPFTQEEFEMDKGLNKKKIDAMYARLEKLNANGVAPKYRKQLEVEVQNADAVRKSIGDSPEKVLDGYSDATHIHSISFENKSKDKNMEEIAIRTGGTHHFIAAPERERILARAADARAKANAAQAKAAAKARFQAALDANDPFK